MAGKPKRRRQQIHGLRVATRRAAAALDLFRDCLPKSTRKEARGSLRMLRQAVGVARDWDVLLQHLAKSIRSADPADLPTLDMLSGWALAHRTDAQSALERVVSESSPRALAKLQARVRESVRWKGNPEPTLDAFSQPIVRQRLGDFTRLANRDNDDWSNLHEVRIAGKRLRYTLEVLASGLDSTMTEQPTTALVRLQDVLGGINDSFLASQLFAGLLSGMQATTPAASKRYQTVLKRLIAEHQQRMLDGREAFTDWLREWHRPQIEQSLEALCGKSG